MSPKALLTLFSLFIFLVLVYTGYLFWQEKFELYKPEAVAYFFKGEELVPVKQTLEKGADPIKGSLDRLLAGPPEADYISALPAGLSLLSYERKGEVLSLDLGPGLLGFSGGTAKIKAGLAQLVYTATAQKGINKVELRAGGPAGPLVLGGEGYTIDKPLGRRDVDLE